MPEPTEIRVSTAARDDLDVAIVAHLFDRTGELLETAEVEDGVLRLQTDPATVATSRLYLAPRLERAVGSASELERLGAYEPLRGIRHVPDLVEIPGPVLDLWPVCGCFVRGRVVNPDGEPICNAIVHVCEVDAFPAIVARLPEHDLWRLRDDIVESLAPPFPPVPRPQPRPPVFRFDPREVRDPVAPPADPELQRLARQLSNAPVPVARRLLVKHVDLLVPWLCGWPRWWHLFRCDEVAEVSTDQDGRFQALFLHNCADTPDLYFWVEYDLGNGPEVVHRPPRPCGTWWDHDCNDEVTVTVSDPRVPTCQPDDLPGCQVAVLSIGRDVAVRELRTSAAGAALEGLTDTDQPFGGTLEPRVAFSRTCLIDDLGIPYYRWSYRRLSGPDGVGNVVAPGSEPIGAWKPLTRTVHRHHQVNDPAGMTFPSEEMGPKVVGAEANLFRIRPVAPPAGSEDWVVLDERVDLATGHFETTKLPGAPGPGDVEDLAAGRYELKLELFDAAGTLVNWTDAGIDLRITDQDAPFGSGAVSTSAAPADNRVLVGGKTVAFRMVLRVDNSRCGADVLPVAGDVLPDPACGFHEYAPGDDVRVGFTATHPNGHATYDFDVVRGATTPIAAASTTGVVGQPNGDGFAQVGDDLVKDVPAATLVGGCPSAAFGARLRVFARATDGYHRLSGYDAGDVAGFALTPQ